MAKDAPVAFRITAELKRKLEKIADEEGRSISQVCEIFLWLGVDAYQESGPDVLKKTMLRHRGK